MQQFLQWNDQVLFLPVLHEALEKQLNGNHDDGDREGHEAGQFSTFVAFV